MLHMLARPLLITACVLLVPLIAMQFTNEVAWELLDFVVMGILVCSISFAYEFLTRNTQSTKRKLLIGGALLFVLLALWVELAVGIFN